MMFNGQNALIAYLEFDNLEKIASETARISTGSKAILHLMKDPELNIQLAISTGLTCPIRELWSNLTKTTTRRGFSDKIGELKARIQRLMMQMQFKAAIYFWNLMDKILILC